MIKNIYITAAVAVGAVDMWISTPDPRKHWNVYVDNYVDNLWITVDKLIVIHNANIM